MVELKVKIQSTYTSRLFATQELAILYRDYHLYFGDWTKYVSWIKEDLLTSEQRKMSLEEKNELQDGVLYKIYLVPSGIEISLGDKKPQTPLNLWKDLRDKRNGYLVETDWTQLSDSPLTAALKKEYKEYRNYLRVLPTLYNENSIESAVVRTFIEWRTGLR
jgi:hypothetical protein